jgi:hypothetical protein
MHKNCVAYADCRRNYEKSVTYCIYLILLSFMTAYFCGKVLQAIEVSVVLAVSP